MMNTLKHLVVALACIVSAAVLASCVSPASAPTAPAEIPTPIVLKLVEFEDLQIDLSSLAGDISAAVSKAIAPGDDVTDVVEWSVERVNAYEEAVLIPITKGLGAIEIPVDENIQAFEGEVTFTQLSELLLDTLFGTHNVKLDFRDFDFDGDGVNEGCSGHTAELPICMKFWLDDVRFIAWVFDEYPVEGITVGRGRFKIELPDIYGIGWEIAIYYDETLGANESKGYDAFMKGTIGDDSIIYVTGPEEWNTQFVRPHLKVLRDGPEATALKFVDLNMAWDILYEGTTPMMLSDKTSGRFLEGFDFWSGSFFRQNIKGGVVTDEGEQDICAQKYVPLGGNPNLNWYVAVEPELCEDVGGRDIRIGVDPLFPADGHPFISTVTDADVAMPAGFSLAPPADFDTLPKP